MKSEQVRKQSSFLSAIELLALVNLAIAQPVFNVLSKGPEFFLVRRSSGIEIVAFVAAISIILPLFVWLIEQIVKLFSKTVAKYFHELLVFVLIAIFFLSFVKGSIFLSDPLKLIVALSISALIVILRSRYPPIKSFFLFLFPAIIAVPLIFLITSAITKVVSGKTPAIPVYKIQASAPVVILVLDEFPLSVLLNKEGNLDCQRYPNFCKFADTATWFKRASSVSDRTQEAVTSLLTGRYPVKESLPTIFDHPENLFTLLHQTYELKAQEALTSLSPAQANAHVEQSSFIENETGMLSDSSAVFLQTVLPSSYAAHFPSVQQTWSNFWESGGAKKSKRDKELSRGDNLNLFISEIKNEDRPGFYFKHVILPHGPWQYFPSGLEYNFARYAQPAFEDRGDNWTDEVSASRALQRLMLQTGFVDLEINKLMKRLKDVGLFDSAVIVIIGDHGISFKYGDERRALTELNRADIASIPLFIKHPNQNEGIISELPVETIDVLPSIADALGIKIPWKVDGKSALGEDYRPRTERRMYRWLEGKGELRSFLNFGTSHNALTIQSMFGTDRPFDEAFYCAEFPSVCGQPDRSLNQVSFTLDQSQLFEDVKLKSGFVPALITGKIPAQTLTGNAIYLAASVNGVIRGISGTFRLNDNDYGFGIMVPPESFREGRNEIGVFRLPKDKK